jgi:putative flavoprotein involved in K+ transport
VLDERGRPVHERGVTAVPGLYFLGLPWQHTRGSALLGWVGRDAAWLAERIAARPRAPGAAVTTAPGQAQAAAVASSSNGGRIE